MDIATDLWTPARLIPVSGVTASAEQETRATSSFLAILMAVSEFGRSLTGGWGAFPGTLETFIEVTFKRKDKVSRPDGLIRVTRGSRTWVALVEVKTQRERLKIDQVMDYVTIAKENGFDAVVTISNQIPISPGAHPLEIEKRKLGKVGLHHISWAQIRAEAEIQKLNKTVKDPDQAWMLSEFIRFLDYQKSGVIEFEGMGNSWELIRKKVGSQILRPKEVEATHVAYHFDQLIEFAALQLSRTTGVRVKQWLSKDDVQDPHIRTSKQAERLASSGDLLGRLSVPDTTSPIDVTADLRSERIEASATMAAPLDRTAKARITWLTRQLRGAAEASNILVRADVHRSRQPGISKSLNDVIDDPSCLLVTTNDDIRSFRVSLGIKGQMKKEGFPKSLLGVVQIFYKEVVQNVKPWVPPAPKVKIEEIQDDPSDIEPEDLPKLKSDLGGENV